MSTSHQPAIPVRDVPGLQQQLMPDLLSREQAAAYLGVAVQTLATWKSAKRYDLPFVKVGRLVKYRRSELDAFIGRHSGGQSTSAI